MQSDGNNVVRGESSASSQSQGSYSNFSIDQGTTGLTRSSSPEMLQGSMTTTSPLIMALMVFTGIRRSWKWAIPIGLVIGCAIAAIVWFVYPIKYTATARIRIYTEKPYFAFKDEAERGAYDSFVNTQLSVMLSPIILDKVMVDQEVARLPFMHREKDPQKWLISNLNIGPERKGAESFKISISTENKDEARIIVNQILKQYTNYYRDESTSWNRELLDSLDQELKRKAEVIKFAQNNIRTKIEQIYEQGGAPIAQDSKSTIGGGATIAESSFYSELMKAEADIESLRQELLIAESFNKDTAEIPEILVTDAVEQMRQSKSIPFEAEIQQMEADIENMSSRVTNPSADREIKRYRERLDFLKLKQREAMEKIGSTGNERDIAEKMLRDRLAVQAANNLLILKDQVKATESRLAKLRERNQKMNDESRNRAREMINVVFQQQQLERDNAVLDILQKRVTALQTEATAPQRVRVLHEAATPRDPDMLQKYMLTGMAGLGLFILPLVLGIAMEFMKPRLYHTSQIRSVLPGTIIGEIMEPPVAWVHGTTFRKRLARYRESVHNWCTYLLLSNPYKQCRTMAIASVAGDDGKTFLAVQIAVAMAQMKSGPVLLIDGDMRVGRLHLLFGNEESGIGLADVLSFRHGIGEAVVMNEKEPNLHLLSAGNLMETSPYELLGDGRFRELLDTLEKHYSLILVVVPPVSNASESLLMSSAVDSTILCVRQGATVLGAMQEVHRRLCVTGCHVDGIVVKDIPYYQMAGKDGGFADKVEQIRLSHLIQYSE